MTIVIPLRVLTAFAGLIAGYYVGYFIEDKRRADSNFSKLYHTLATAYSTAALVNDMLSDLDDDCGAEIFFDVAATDTSDEDTEYSSESETRDDCTDTVASGSLCNSQG